MRRLFIDIADFVYGWLPTHKLQAVRIQFFTKLQLPFVTLMNDYISWRDAKITASKVTGETLSIQWYLNQLFDPIANSITIESIGVSGLSAGLETGGEDYVSAGNEGETPDTYAVAGLSNADYPPFNDKSFIVNIPSSLASQQEAIKQVVATYKCAGKSYKIILF